MGEKVITAEQDMVIEKSDLDRLIKRYGKRTLEMGTLDNRGSLHVARECVPETGLPLGPESGEGVGSFIDHVIESRKRRIVELTRAVQNAPTEAEAKQCWGKLEHLMFGS